MVPEDFDGDGWIDLWDTDDDNDGHLDTQDDLPFDPRDWIDDDADGIGVNVDTDDDDPTVTTEGGGHGRQVVRRGGGGVRDPALEQPVPARGRRWRRHLRRHRRRRRRERVERHLPVPVR